MKPHVERLLDVKMTRFRPMHQNNLSNEFRCYANYEGPFGWDEEE